MIRWLRWMMKPQDRPDPAVPHTFRAGLDTRSPEEIERGKRIEERAREMINPMTGELYQQYRGRA